MKLDFRLRGWKSNAPIRQFVEEQLDQLPSVGFVRKAQVVLVHERSATPAWTARAHLEIPGPDLRAEACDHTFEAAWRKVMVLLNDQVSRRLDRRRHRADESRRLRPAARAS